MPVCRHGTIRPSTGQIFNEMSYLKTFRKSVEKFYSCLLRAFQINNSFIEPTKWAILCISLIVMNEYACRENSGLIKI
jgi:hypothetical protein